MGALNWTVPAETLHIPTGCGACGNNANCSGTTTRHPIRRQEEGGNGPGDVGLSSSGAAPCKRGRADVPGTPPPVVYAETRAHRGSTGERKRLTAAALS